MDSPIQVETLPSASPFVYCGGLKIFREIFVPPIAGSEKENWVSSSGLEKMVGLVEPTILLAVGKSPVPPPPQATVIAQDNTQGKQLFTAYTKGLAVSHAIKRGAMLLLLLKIISNVSSCLHTIPRAIVRAVTLSRCHAVSHC